MNREEAEAIWAKANELGRKYNHAYNKFRLDLKKNNPEFLVLQNTIKELSLKLKELRKKAKYFAKDKKPPELIELQIESQKAWKESQKASEELWKEEKKEVKE